MPDIIACYHSTSLNDYNLQGIFKKPHSAIK